MAMHYKGHEFEALRCQFENHTQRLYQMTLIDLRIFTGYITLQLALGAWIATHTDKIGSPTARVGLLAVDFALAGVAWALLHNSYRRRTEVVATVRNCNKALGFEDAGIYLEDSPLNSHTEFRPWAGWYYTGIVVGFIGVTVILFGAS